MHRLSFSLISFKIESFSTTSTPLRSRSPNAPATEVDSRSTSVPPLTRKTSVRALFTTSTPSAFILLKKKEVLYWYKFPYQSRLRRSTIVFSTMKWRGLCASIGNVKFLFRPHLRGSLYQCLINTTHKYISWLITTLFTCSQISSYWCRVGCSSRSSSNLPATTRYSWQYVVNCTLSFVILNIICRMTDSQTAGDRSMNDTHMSWGAVRYNIIRNEISYY